MGRFFTNGADKTAEVLYKNRVEMRIFMKQLKKELQFKKDILFLAGLFLGILFLVWKSKYGTGAYDEPFYLTIPHRIVNGDGMFAEEWNFGQFSSFLLLPVMKCYLFLVGSTEGIILNFRYIYIVFQVICTLVIYIRLRKRELAWAAAWLFLLFCPYDIMAVSYNVMGIAFITITGVLLAGAGEKDRAAWLVSGLLFAGAVLCNPFLALLYFAYSVLVFGVAAVKKRKTGQGGVKEKNISVQAWLFITAGAGILAMGFVLTVLSQSPLSKLLENIPLLMNDPEHTSRSLFMIVKVYLQSFWNVYGWFVPVWSVLLLMAYCYRKEQTKRKLCFVLLSLSAVISLLGFVPTIQNSYNFIMVPIAVCGLGAYIMTREKDKRTFYFLFCLGIAYTFIANYASNQGMHAISMAMLPADVAALLFIGRFAAQERGESQKASGLILGGAAALLLTAQLGMQVYTKAVHAFWEEPVYKLDTVIEEGPLKGTVTTKEKAEDYKEMLTDIKEHIKKEGPVLFAMQQPWCYLYADTGYATFSSYLSGGIEQAAKQWDVYFEAHPEKIPLYIYIPKEETNQWETAVYEAAEKYGYRIEESGAAYHLYGK